MPVQEYKNYEDRMNGDPKLEMVASETPTNITSDEVFLPTAVFVQRSQQNQGGFYFQRTHPATIGYGEQGGSLDGGDGGKFYRAYSF